jgi:uncharacterized protein
MQISRRQVIASSAAGAGLWAVGLTPASTAFAAPKQKQGGSGSGAVGPLIDDPAGLLALPAGFSYQVISQVGVTTLTTGQPSPDRPDGMGAFKAGRNVRIVQNHEISPRFSFTNVVPQIAGTVFDAGLVDGGGCTVIEVDRNGNRISEWVGLSGTLNNCGGGVTPWGSWLTCEEDTSRAGSVYSGNTLQQDHGWVFEVQPDAPAAQDPRPVKCWGRFPHEAVVVHPERRTVYLTEDASGPNGLFYRWTAPRGVELGRGTLQQLGADAGNLEVMQVSVPGGGPVGDLSQFTSADIGRQLDVNWVEVPDRLATTTDTRKQTYPAPITRAKKLEGAWGSEKGVYFASSFAFASDIPVDGAKHDGQIWFLDYESGKLVMVAYFPYIDQLHDGSWSLAQQKTFRTDYFDGPDNVHVSPWGGLVIAEDGVGVNGLVGWTPESGAFRLARNDVDFNGENSEMTGPTFSPDGSLLFANAQEPGHTYAISGNFRGPLTTAD